MNPSLQPAEQPNTPVAPGVTPDIDPATFVPKETSVEADSIALDAIGELEAEEDTVGAAVPENEGVISTEALKPVQTDSVASSMPVPSDISAPVSVPAQTNSNPFPVQKNSPKKRILTLIAAVVLFGAGVAGFFVWQSMQNNNSHNTIQETTGNQPGGTSTNASANTPADTETSVNDAADSLTTTADSINDTSYDDATLSDTTLYGN